MDCGGHDPRAGHDLLMPTQYIVYRPAAITALIRQVAIEHGVTSDDMIGRRRTCHIAWARFDCWHRIRQLRGPGGRPFSSTQIGVWFDRDHTSVLNGLQRYQCTGCPPPPPVRIAA